MKILSLVPVKVGAPLRPYGPSAAALDSISMTLTAMELGIRAQIVPKSLNLA
jgi:hypothetical protein